MGEGALLGTSLLTSGAGGFVSAYGQAQALEAQGKFQAQQYEFNKKIAEAQAADAISQGDTAISQHKKETNQLVGAERSSAAASGIDIGSGSASQIINDTKYLSKMDELTIKNNAWRTAWGFKTEAASYGASGANAYLAGQNAAGNTLLTGGLNFASKAIEGASKVSWGRGKTGSTTSSKGTSYGGVSSSNIG